MVNAKVFGRTESRWPGKVISSRKAQSNLVDIPERAVIRSARSIGLPLQPIPRGSWVKEDQLRMPTAPPLDSLPLSTEVPETQAPLEGFTFEGYRNADGTVGTRNILGITTTVQCVTGVLDHAVKRIKDELLPKYPHVDDVVALTHSYGCGVAITATDAYFRSAPCAIWRATRIWAARRW